MIDGTRTLILELRERVRRLEDWTPRLHTLRDRTGEADLRPPPKPPFAPAVTPPGYDARDIFISSRNFR